MHITDIRIKRTKPTHVLLAYATVTFDDCFVIHNIKILNGREGHFIAMPRRKTANGQYKDIAHPLNTEFRNTLQNAILEAFKKEDFGERENKED